jgi:hypothetical protein
MVYLSCFVAKHNHVHSELIALIKHHDRDTSLCRPSFLHMLVSFYYLKKEVFYLSKTFVTADEHMDCRTTIFFNKDDYNLSKSIQSSPWRKIYILKFYIVGG